MPATSAATGAVLEDDLARARRDGECRTTECTQPVYGTTVLCAPCMILFGPYEILTANPEVTEWLSGELPEPAPVPTTKRRKEAERSGRPKSDAG